MIKVDFEGVLPQPLLALMSDQFIETVLDDVATAARAKWIRLAQTELHSSKRDYIDSIQDVEGSGNERIIALVGWLANAVENGMEAYDLRDTLLGGGKGKKSKDGHRYRAIPFRHGTPGSGGQGGTPMGSRMGPQGGQSLAWASQGQASRLGKRIYAAAKQLEQGSRLRTSERRRKGFIQVPKLAPWHKTDIFSGMTKVRKTYAAATQSQYMTFRTISDANPAGWIHPGIQARHLARQVEEHVKGIVVKSIEAAVREAFK
jgi:hypothetical protein